MNLIIGDATYDVCKTIEGHPTIYQVLGGGLIKHINFDTSGFHADALAVINDEDVVLIVARKREGKGE